MREENPRWRAILGAACFVIFAIFGSLVSTSGLIGFIRDDLGLSYGAGGFLLSVPFPVIALFAVAGGRLVDRMGVRKIVSIGVSFALLGGAVRVLGGSFWTLASGIALVGAGTGLVFPVMPKVAASILPAARKEFGSALYTASITAGAGSGVAASHWMAPAAGALPAAWGGSVWRGGYLVWAIILLAAFAVWRGSAGAIAEEARLESPSAKGGATYRMPVVWAVGASLFINSVVFYTSLGWLPTALAGKGWTRADAALLVSSVSWLGVPASLTAHRTAAALGGERMAVLACAFLAASALVLTSGGDSWAAAAGVAALGWVLNCWYLFCLSWPAQYVERARVGQAGGLIIGMGYLGGFVGPWAIGAVRDWAGSFAPGFYALAGLAISAAVFVPFFGRRADLDGG